MFSRPVIAIELTPVSCDVSIVGRPGARVHLELDRAAWDNTWSGGLRALDEPLRSAVRRLGVSSKARAIVVYPGPDAVADLISVRSSVSEAAGAAKLALRESGLDMHGPVAAKVFDHSGEGRGAQSRVMVAGDTSVAAEAVADWVRRAGLQLEGMTSTRAAVLVAAIRQCASITAGDHVVVELHEHATGVVGISGGRIAFARVLSFGFDLLLEAIARGARDVTKDSGMPLSRAELREILFKVGAPGKNDILHEKLGLRGEHVLPLMHPVLQRFAVEIRQTLRFAKIEGAGDTQNVLIAGPGAAIRDIAGVFGEFVDAPVETAVPGARSESVIDARAAGAVDAGMMYAPASELSVRGQRLVRRGVQVGAVAAAAVLAVCAADVGHALRTQQQRLDHLRPELARIEDIHRQREDLRAMIRSVRTEDASIRQAIGDRVCWSSGVADLARVVPRGVTLLEITGSIDARAQDREGGPTMSIKGFSPVAADGQQTDAADAFAEGLRKSMVLTGVEFTSSRVLQSDEGGTRQFILSAKPLAVPAQIAIGGQP